MPSTILPMIFTMPGNQVERMNNIIAALQNKAMIKPNNHKSAVHKLRHLRTSNYRFFATSHGIVGCGIIKTLIFLGLFCS